MTERLAEFLIRRLVRAQQREAMSGFERRGLVELTGPNEDGAPTGFRICATREEIAEALAPYESRRGSHPAMGTAPATVPSISLALRSRQPEGIDVDDPLFDEALSFARGDPGGARNAGDEQPDNDDHRPVKEVAIDQGADDPAPAAVSDRDATVLSGAAPEHAASTQGDEDLAEPWSKAETISVIRAMRSTAERPRPDEIASVLLLAKAVRSSGTSIEALLDTLRSPRPIVVLISPLYEVLVQILRGLERGMILPGPYELKEGRGLLNTISSWRSNWTTRRMITFVLDESDVRKITRARMKELVSRIMAAREPVLVVAQAIAAVPQRMIDAADLVLDTGPLDATNVHRTIEICLGSAPVETIADDLCVNLDLTDLITAIRPGATPESATASLRRYAAENAAAKADDEEDEDRLSAKRGTRSGGAAAVTEAILIEPELTSSAPTIDTASGYGAAITWAQELRLDLVDWRNGIIPWSALSSRVLLAGPPGTGKTTFAKILGRSLGVPVLLTSPSHWLEGGHLGDVLKRMKAVFAEARARAPAILFIDELDGLGARMSDLSQPYASYHRNVIDQALLLIDGTGASEGVILIGATNRPEDLDPALVRSGRLEQRIDIELPDEEALAGIIAQHVGDALREEDDVVAEPDLSASPIAGVASLMVKATGDAPPRDGLRPEVRPTEKSTYPDPHEEASGGKTGAPHSDLFRRLAHAARGLSGADVERLVRTARQTARRDRRSLTPSDLIEMFSRRHRAMPDDLRWRMAIHEAGHVIAHRVLGFGEPVSTYIDPRGGVTVAKAFDRAPTEAALTKLLVMLLAGRAAEELMLGEISAGAGGSENSDLAKATTLACRMEAQFGFVSLVHNTDQEMATRLVADHGFAKRVQVRLDEAHQATVSALIRCRSEVEDEARRISDVLR